MNYYHPSSDKPWMTPRIKLEIKAREKAYTSGDNAKYEMLCRKVTSFISKAKANYYQFKAENMRATNNLSGIKLYMKLLLPTIVGLKR